MASKKFTQFDTANNTPETELSVGVKGTDNFKRRNYLTATANPTVNDDNSDGYTVGSFWFNASTGTMYICKDSTVGAAVWVTQGITSITSTDGSIDINNDNPSAPDLSIPSGTWTPVITNVTGGATVLIASDGIYSRAGNIVTCSAAISVTLNENESAETTFEFSLPVTTSFVGGGKLFGAFSGQTRSQQGYFLNQIFFAGVNGESKAFVGIVTSSDTTEGSQWSFQFVVQYVIE